MEAGPWTKLLEEERTRIGYRRGVLVRVSECLVSPAAWGILRPVIFIPATMATGLSPEVMRMILLHELSHLRRWDPLVQALQQVVEAFFFFNPFVWILSRQINLEREACCDAIAADHGGVSSYAQVLLDLRRTLGGGFAAQSALAVDGDRRASSLGVRIRRLVRPSDCPSSRPSVRLLLASLILAAIVGFVGRQAADAAVSALSHQEWMQKIQDVLERERREDLPVEWRPGDRMTISGRVTDENGEPIEGALVHFQMSRIDGNYRMATSARTDIEGRYERGMELCDYSPPYEPYVWVNLCVLSPGYDAREIESMQTEKGTVRLDFELGEGTPVRIEVVDENRSPVADAEVSFQYSPIGSLMEGEYRTRADGVVFVDVPSEYELGITVRAKGFRNASVKPRVFSESEDNLTVVLKKGPPIRGRIRDAVSDEPISGAGVFLSESAAVNGSTSSGYSFWVGDDDPLVRSDESGEFAIDSLSSDEIHWLPIQAEGYLVGFPGPWDSRKDPRIDSAFALAPGNEMAEIRLIPQKEIPVKVLLPDGWLYPGQSSVKVQYSHHYSVGATGGRIMTHGSRIRSLSASVKNGALEFSILPTMALPLTFRIGGNKGPSKSVEGWTNDELILLDLRGEPLSQMIGTVYTVDFDLKEGEPLPKGELSVQYVDEGDVSGEKRVPFVAGVARFYIEHQVDWAPRIGSERVVGYYFEEQELPVEKNGSKDPVVYTVHSVVSAGAVEWVLSGSDPGERTHLSIDLEERRKSFDGAFFQDWKTIQRIDLPLGENRVTVNPIPLGVPARIEVRQGNLLYRSDPFVLDEDDPFPTRILELPKGEVVGGRLLDPDGLPLKNTGFQLCCIHDHSQNSSVIYYLYNRTDEEGYFRFDRVNFEYGGSYFLDLIAVPGAASTKVLVEGAAEDLTVRMEPSLPFTVRVVEAASGEAMVGREIQVDEVGLPDELRFLGRTLRPAQVTDRNGEIVLEGLPVEGMFSFRVWLPVKDDSRVAYYERVDLAPDPEDRSITIRVPESRL